MDSWCYTPCGKNPRPFRRAKTLKHCSEKESMLRKLVCVSLLSIAAAVTISGQSPDKPKPPLALPAQAEGASEIEFIEGKVLLVIDGDQFRVKTADGTAYTVRLHGIDAPEDMQPFGPESQRDA